MPPDSADAGLNHLRSSCDELLAKATSDSDSEHYNEAEPEESLGLIELDETLQPGLAQSISTPKPYSRRASFIRVLALLCACSLSVGSH